uniref:Putative mevalonate kinase mvk/erg12 n=1 Tax=Nyssomyia neivai TaxID=330878 RepID=A0A1L8DYL1_9DIPT
MVKFEVSAPGKVILHGEHSVVYGKPAVAGVVQVRNTLTLEENDDQCMLICFPKIGLDNLHISLEAINKFLAICWEKYGAIEFPEGLNHDVFLEEVKNFVQETVKEGGKDFLDSIKLNSLSAVFYLLLGIFIEGQIRSVRKGIKIDLKTEMSVGAGLGSSASFGVCLAATFYLLARLVKQESYLDDYNGLTEMQQHDIKQKISSWAFQSEKIMHGNPSGLDNTICTFGNVVKFYKGRPPVDIKLTCSLPILLVDSGVSRSTAKLVENVVDLRKRHPKNR